MNPDSYRGWSDEPARLKIRVMPLWYRTWLAYSLYAAALIGLIVWYLRTKERRQQLQLALERKQGELEIQRREAEHAEAMNRLKLEEFAQRLLEKSKLVADLEEQLVRENGNPEAQEGDDDARKQLLKRNILTKEDWADFQTLFEQAYPGFQAQLAGQFSQLTAAETRVVLLAKMGLKNNQASAMLGVSLETVKKTRNRMHKKLGAQDASLQELLAEN